jgi:hypothetical protein
MYRNRERVPIPNHGPDAFAWHCEVARQIKEVEWWAVPQKIPLGQMREMGIRGLLVYGPIIAAAIPAKPARRDGPAIRLGQQH